MLNQTRKFSQVDIEDIVSEFKIIDTTVNPRKNTYGTNIDKNSTFNTVDKEVEKIYRKRNNSMMDVDSNLVLNEFKGGRR